MKQKAIIAGAIAIAAGFAVISATIATHPASASSGAYGANPNLSCGSASACLTWTNSGTGQGIAGTSSKGAGLFGATKSNTTTFPGPAGVFGSDTSSTGFKDFGVRGLSVRGIGTAGQSSLGNGVFGKSGSNNGVLGQSSTSSGVLGTGAFGTAGFGSIGGAFGAGSSASSYGVEGENNSSGTSDAFVAYGLGGRLFRGYDQGTNTNVFIIDNAGNVTANGGASIGGGITSSLAGSFGASETGFGGVVGSNFSGAVSAVYANGFGNNLFLGNNSAGHIVFYVDDGGNIITSGLIFTAGGCSTGCIRQGGSEEQVVSYAPRVSQPTMEDFGEAQLVGGEARVKLDASYSAVIDRNASYLVFVTPEGDCRGLYVTDRSSAGFTVRELQGGRSTLAFSYRIVARPFGRRMARLPLVTMTNGDLTRSQKIALMGTRPSSRHPGGAAKPLVPTLVLPHQ